MHFLYGKELPNLLESNPNMVLLDYSYLSFIPSVIELDVFILCTIVIQVVEQTEFFGNLPVVSLHTKKFSFNCQWFNPVFVSIAKVLNSLFFAIAILICPGPASAYP